jgi:hypothetical protein
VENVEGKIMTNFSQWLNDVLGNEKLLRDIRTGMAVTASLLLAIIYWGFVQNFDFSGIQLTRVLGLTIVFSVSVFIVRLEFKARGFQAEMDENKELQEIEKTLFNEDINIQYDELGIQWVSDFNTRGQEKANRIKTENRIMKLQEKRRNKIRNNRPIADIDLEIERLKNDNLIDTRFKPLRYTDLISKGADYKKNKDVIDRDQIYYNPVKQGNVSGFFSTFLRSIIPGSIGITFLLEEPVINIVLYYVFLIVAFAWTISTQYVLTRRNTATKYFDTRKNKLTLLREMKNYIQSELSKTKVEQQDAQISQNS